MPKTEAGRIRAWSFSRYKDYCTCPLRAKLKYVDGRKEPGSAAMDRGSMIHKLAEDYCNGKIKALPTELKLFKAEFLKLRKGKPRCEEQWAFTKDWKETSWFSKDAWCRIKTDALVFTGTTAALIIDHKTGKPYEDHEEQLGLYALGTFLLHPELKEVTAADWYIDHGPSKTLDRVFTREQLPALKKLWESKVEPMLNDTRFVPKPSRACLRCFFRKENGGPCKF